MARIIVVDDDHDQTDSLVKLLKLWGHETRKAYDGESLVQLSLAFSPHAILLDIGLPRTDGYAVVRRLRQYKQLVGVVIAAVTGYARPEDVAKCRDAGFDEHFAKPVNVERLKAYLDSLGPCDHDQISFSATSG